MHNSLTRLTTDINKVVTLIRLVLLSEPRVNSSSKGLRFVLPRDSSLFSTIVQYICGNNEDLHFYITEAAAILGVTPEVQVLKILNLQQIFESLMGSCY